MNGYCNTMKYLESIVRGLHRHQRSSIKTPLSAVSSILGCGCIWLARLLAAPISTSHFLFLQEVKVNETSVLVAVSISCTAALTAGESMIRVPRISADPASTSALLLSRTPAWPWEKIHTILSSWLAVMAGFKLKRELVIIATYSFKSMVSAIVRDFAFFNRFTS